MPQIFCASHESSECNSDWLPLFLLNVLSIRRIACCLFFFRRCWGKSGSSLESDFPRSLTDNYDLSVEFRLLHVRTWLTGWSNLMMMIMFGIWLGSLTTTLIAEGKMVIIYASLCTIVVSFYLERALPLHFLLFNLLSSYHIHSVSLLISRGDTANMRNDTSSPT